MLTRQEILHEFVKCLSDPKYAIEHFLQTFDKTQEGFVPFMLFPRQQEIIDAYEEYRFNIVTKPRQAGVSTTTAAYLAIKTGFGDPKNPEKILILANKQTMAQEFLSKVKDFLEQLPRWVWGDEYYGTSEKEKKSIFLTNSKGYLILPNRCEIKAVATSKDALRGFTPTYLIMDEAAFIDNGEEVFNAALTALGTGGHAMLVSTPNGMDKLYYTTYEGAKTKKNDFHIIEMHWYEDLRYNKDLKWHKDEEDRGVIIIDEIEFTFESYEKKIKDGFKPTSNWYETMCRNMNGNARMIAQELDVSFIGSGGNVISDEYIQYHETHFVMEPKFLDGKEDEFWIWEEPQEGHQYIMGCLPPGEKVLTDSGLKNVEDILLDDKLINENGEYVDIDSCQTYTVIDEDIFEVKVDNTFRTTTFTKEHPILISKPNLKRNYNKKHNEYKFNERYWDFDFNYEKISDVKVGDWVKVPNIYRKNVINDLTNRWNISEVVRCDFEFDSPLNDTDFWWFIGMWLGDGWLGKNGYSYSISICFDKVHYQYIEKIENIIKRLFNRSPSFIDKGTTFEVVFNSKFLYYFILENFGQYSYGKQIPEWVKFILPENKKELIRGYFDSDGCWVKTIKNNKINSKVSFVSVNLSLLESIQDIIFSLGVVSSLNKLRDAGTTKIRGVDCQQKKAYNLCLANYDSLELINLIYKENDNKLNKFNLSEFSNINKRIISSCHFDTSKDFIYFKIKDIIKSKFSGNVHNFECDTHTFMCHHITTHNCDVSRGDGEDSSTIVIVDFTTMEQVMEYKGKVQPDLLGELVFKYGNLYKAYTVVDITGGMGVATVLKLLDMDYKYLHYDDPKSKLLLNKAQLAKFAKDGDKIPGFNVGSSRLTLVAHLERSIRENLIKIRSRRLTSEMKTFVYKSGRPDHMEGFHDDLLMSLGMALWVLEHSFKNLERLEKQTKAMLDSWVMGSSKDETETGGFVPSGGRSISALPKPKFNSIVSKNMQDPKGEFLWLFSGMR
jgi:hypothetical protein